MASLMINRNSDGLLSSRAIVNNNLIPDKCNSDQLLSSGQPNNLAPKTTQTYIETIDKIMGTLNDHILSIEHNKTK